MHELYLKRGRQIVTHSRRQWKVTREWQENFFRGVAHSSHDVPSEVFQTDDR
jgi:hypothetical protein